MPAPRTSLLAGSEQTAVGRRHHDLRKLKTLNNDKRNIKNPQSASKRKSASRKPLPFTELGTLTHLHSVRLWFLKCFHIHHLRQDPTMSPSPHRAHAATQPTARKGQDSNPAPTTRVLGDPSQRAACFRNQALLLSQRLQVGGYNLSAETHSPDPNIYFCPKRPVR